MTSQPCSIHLNGQPTSSVYSPPMPKLLHAASLTLVSAFVASQALAQAKEAEFLSGPFTLFYIGAGLASPLIRDGKSAKAHFARESEALVATVLLTEGIKSLTHVPRPDTGDHDSFPSGHASAAFAIATMEANFHPNEAVYWFVGAAAISNSRLTLERHRLADVLAGAALGYAVARLELGAPRGWVVSPWVAGSGSYGVAVAVKF